MQQVPDCRYVLLDCANVFSVLSETGNLLKAETNIGLSLKELDAKIPRLLIHLSNSSILCPTLRFRCDVIAYLRQVTIKCVCSIWNRGKPHAF